MSLYPEIPYTDEEIVGELEKIGYYDVSDELLDLLKEDLASLLAGEESSDLISSAFNGSSWCESSSSKISISPVKQHHIQHLPTMLEKPCSAQLKKTSAPQANSNKLSKKSYRNKENVKVQNAERPNSSLEERVVRRKVFRRVNGEPVITEQYRTACYSTGSSSDWSSDTTIERDECRPSSSRPVLCSIIDSSGNSTNRSQSSKKSGVVLPKPNVRHKKCDPVTRYHEYRKFWEAFKPPGDGKHKFLRWTIKQKMLDYDFA